MLASRSRTLVVGVILLISIIFYLQTSAIGRTRGYKVDAVVVQLKAEDTAWMRKYFPQWNHKTYVVDDSEAPLTVAKNKGRESMAYLTYIIDNYDSLPDIILFLHAQRWQWHNDDPDYDGYGVLKRLQLPYIREVGFVNLRCAWALGCPMGVNPFDSEPEVDEPDTDVGKVTIAYQKAYKSEFEILFPGVEVPQTIGAACCAQFAVSKEKIHERPKSDYSRYRKWLLDTELDDGISGRILEYSWHMIFGKEPVHCPDARECYCRLYGLCRLQCQQHECGGRYTLPPYATLPIGWPLIDWDDSPRNFDGPISEGEQVKRPDNLS